MIPTWAASAHATSGGGGDAFDGFTRPTDISLNSGVNKMALSIHSYMPGDFTGVTGVNGSWSEANITGMMNPVQTAANALGMPVVLGEYGAVARHATHSNSAETTRNNWARTYVEQATRRGMVTVWWDTGIRQVRSDGPQPMVAEGRFGLYCRASGDLLYPNIPTAIRAGYNAGRSTQTGWRSLPTPTITGVS